MFFELYYKQEAKMLKKKFSGILIAMLLAGTLLSVVGTVRAVDFYLTLETNPSNVLTIDPNALTGEGLYPSSTCVIVDAKQTVISETVRYEFVEWNNHDPWPFDPEDEENPEPVLTDTQAFIFMDGDRTVTATYEEMFVGEWENGYEDETSGFMLRISTDDKYFQFITPEKVFSITKADSMIVREHSTVISHSDDEIRLFSFSLNSNIDYCLTYARDMQTGQRYLLIDRIGIE